MKTRSIILILLFILLLLVVGMFVLFIKEGAQGSVDTQNTERGGFLNTFFPSNSNIEDATKINREPVLEESSNTNTLIGSSLGEVRLQQLSGVAVGGYQSTTTDRTLFVRYIEQSTGHIFEINPETLVLNRITNTTIPGIRESVWNKNTDQVVLRYLNENEVIKTFVGTITEDENATGTTEGAKLLGYFLDDDISSVVTNDMLSKFMYVAPSVLGGEVVEVVFGIEDPKRVYNSPFVAWNIGVFTDDVVVLTTKASASVFGVQYFFEKNSSSLLKKLGPISGLTTKTNKDLTFTLFSESKATSLTTHGYDIKNNLILDVPFITLPEKCVWSSMSTNIAYCAVPTVLEKKAYPDAWYQGLTEFEDVLWEIDLKQNLARLLVEPKTLISSKIDMIDLLLTEKEDLLLFKNKRDGTLWSVTLPEKIVLQNEAITEEN